MCAIIATQSDPGVDAMFTPRLGQAEHDALGAAHMKAMYATQDVECIVHLAHRAMHSDKARIAAAIMPWP
jgi:hypothetical protein